MGCIKLVTLHLNRVFGELPKRSCYGVRANQWQSFEFDIPYFCYYCTRCLRPPFAYKLALFAYKLALFAYKLALFAYKLALFAYKLTLFAYKLALFAYNLALFAYKLALFDMCVITTDT